jgi:hypothetical protein
MLGKIRLAPRPPFGPAARPLLRRTEEDPPALPRRILPCASGSEARRFNRLLIDAGLIKGL